ncbi:MAG: hypothetical protein ACJ75R_10710 [Solirubrobacterales bacterium]
MTRIRTVLAVCALALPVPVIAAGCGGGSDSSEDPQTVLDETFSNDQSISSGNVNLTVGVNASGDQGGSFNASLTGPFQGDPDNPQSIPQLDWTATAKGTGGGQSIDFSGGLVVTSDNAYVEYKGKSYEVGTDAFKQVKDQIEAQAGAASSAGAPTSFSEGCKQALEQAGATDTSGCDIDLTSWLPDPSNEGTEDVGGTSAIHIHGDLDVQKVLTDIGNLATAFPGASAQGFDPSQLGAFSDAVTEASMDVYSGTDDHLLRKLDLHLTIDPKAIAGAAVAVPIDNIDITFGIELDDVNQQQTISAPSGAQPISQLLSDLGISAGDLGAIPGIGSTGSGGSGSSSGSTDDYFQCLQQAGNDPQAINKCASQL